MAEREALVFAPEDARAVHAEGSVEDAGRGEARHRGGVMTIDFG